MHEHPHRVGLLVLLVLLAAVEGSAQDAGPPASGDAVGTVVRREDPDSGRLIGRDLPVTAPKGKQDLGKLPPPILTDE